MGGREGGREGKALYIGVRGGALCVCHGYLLYCHKRLDYVGLNFSDHGSLWSPRRPPAAP